MDDNLVKVCVWTTKAHRDAFAIACRKMGTTMSAKLRQFIDVTIIDGMIWDDRQNELCTDPTAEQPTDQEASDE